MKKLLLLLSCMPLFSSSADWDLFPLNQKSFYRVTIDNQVNIGVQIMDSIKYNLSDDVHYFRRNLIYENAASCYQNVFPELPTAGVDGFEIDSLVSRNDTIFFSWYGSTLPFFFLPNAIPGQSWTVISTSTANDYNEITITYASIQQETFLGITDSVKTFTMTPNGTSVGQIPVNNFVMKLSKNYGFINYVPFQLFIYHPSSQDFYSADLVGIEKAGNIYGYQHPGLLDYFHLNAGDILFWRHHVDPSNPMYLPWTEFYRDSIVQAFSSPDSVVYDISGLRLDTDFVVTQYNKTSHYLKTEFNDLFNTPSHWVGFQDGPDLPWMWGLSYNVTAWQYNDLSLRIDSLTLDTISHSYFATEDWGLDTVNCQIQLTFDIFRNFTMDTRMGITSYCLYNFGDNCFVLDGAIIGGLHYGNTNFPTAVSELEMQSSITFSPNPFHTTARLEINNSEFRIKNCDLKIYNTLGVLVRQEKISNLNPDSDREYILHRDDLNDGLYFYELLTSDSSPIGTGKFIIE